MEGARFIEVAMGATSLLLFKEGRIMGAAAELERIQREIKDTAKEGRLSCAQAFAIADKLSVDPKKVGEAANNLKIKIVACRLGCF